MKLKVTVDGVDYDVYVDVEPDPVPSLGNLSLGVSGVAPVGPTGGATTPLDDAKTLRAPIAGTVRQVHVQAGQQVTEGDPLFVMEAMKMETEIAAPLTGTVKAVPVAAGDAVQGGDVLIEFE